MTKIETLVDAFTASAINTAVWNNITAGTATLDTVNDQVTLAVPTTSSTNTFGTNTTYDATGSSVYAQVGVTANGSGATRSIMRIRLDGSNSVRMSVESGIFKQALTTAGATTSVTLPTYDPHNHRWWRLREAGAVFYADTSPDGWNWTNLSSMAYTWSATAVTLRFESVATATEVAGNLTAISHVNTRAGGAANPNWPLVEYAWGARWNCNGGDTPLDRYVDQSKLTRSTVGISRGRQYELDQVQSGELSLTLANTTAALDPTNASSPYVGHIQPFQPYRQRAQWPPTRNLLNQFQATGGDLGGIPIGVINQGNSGPSTFCNTDSGSFQTIASSTAWQGGTVIQCLIPNGTTPMVGATGPGVICWTPQPAAEPGATYTLQIRVRNITASTSLQVAPFINSANASAIVTPNVGTPVTLTGAASAWTTLTFTATLGADAASLGVGFGVTTTATAAVTVQVDGWQLEPGSVSSAWACPSPWYPLFAGFVERWPSLWQMAGTYGVVQPTITDAFSLLSQQRLDDALTMEITAHDPRFLYKLDDPSGSLSAADATGTYPAAAIAISKYGAGTLSFGNAITSNTAAGAYAGSTGTVATLANASPGATGNNAASILTLGPAGILGPASATFTRMIAFRYTGTTPTSEADIWSATDTPNLPALTSQMRLVIDSGGHAKIVAAGTGLITLTQSAVAVADSDWHLAFFGANAGTDRVFLAVDGTYTDTSGSSGAYAPQKIATDTIGSLAYSGLGNTTTNNFSGDVSYAVEWPAALTASDCNQIYTAWRSACVGESTNARFARILRYAGYIGPSTIQTGLTTSMGAANISGQDAVSALQAVVDTENGEHYVDRAGTVTFKSRSSRYNATTPTYVFGENASAGEWPYEDCQLDYDSTHLGNLITVTQDGTGQTFNAQDTTSITNYFPRTLGRTVNSSSTLECQDAANYLLSRYKNPATRVSTLKLHPGANPAMWPVCLSLELGTRVRVMRRPPGVPAITVDCFVENIQWSLDASGEAIQNLQCSPADLTPYGIFAAWHTTLNASIASGVTSITVNASADTTNPLATQLAAGQSLILGQSSANQESVTIASVGATASGWSTATITLSAATTKSHSAGDLVNEPLPAGVTDPTAYDAVATFDTTAFAY